MTDTASIDVLVARDPMAMSHEGRLDWLAAVDAARARLDAAMARGLAAVQLDPPPRPTRIEAQRHQWAREEVAVRLRWSHRTTGERMLTAGRAVAHFPVAMAELAAGTVSWRHVEAMVHGTQAWCDIAEHGPGEASGLDDRAERARVRAMLSDLEAAVLPRARVQTPWRFGRTVAATVARLDVIGEDERHARATRDRHVTIVPASAGMSELGGSLPAAGAATVRAALDAVADRLAAQDRAAAVASGSPRRPGRGAVRTRDQLRADALVGICSAVLHDGLLDTRPGPLPAGLRPAVQLTVAASTLLTDDPQPGVLAGYGHLPVSATLALLADSTGTWQRLLTDDRGTVLSVGRSRYRPPTALRDVVEARDRTCRFPGCERRAGETELDHAVAWHRGGTTEAANLVALCARHHHLKHEAGWTVRLAADGAVSWTTPTGWTLTDDPPEPVLDTTVRAGPCRAPKVVPIGNGTDGRPPDDRGTDGRPPDDRGADGRPSDHHATADAVRRIRPPLPEQPPF